MRELAEKLKETVSAAEAELRAIPEATAERRPAPGKWSSKEVLGHLIDSAANNHGRFVRGAIEEDLVFPGYAQEEWVAVQDYQHRRWDELVTLWTSYNLHLSRVIAGIPEDAMTRLRAKHNFDHIAWKLVPASEPSSLEYFVRDYIAHLNHHLKQIRAAVR